MQFLELGERMVPISTTSRHGRIVYRLKIRPPAFTTEVTVTIRMKTATRPWRPSVTTDAPDCRRHRYIDGSLCMWWELDKNPRRWVMGDTLAALVHYVEIHLYQEACCRAGQPWPGEQAPGPHPRPRWCETCGGRGE